MTEITDAMIAAAATETRIDFEGETYDFVLGFPEALQVEKALGKPFIRVLADFSKEPSLTILQAIFRVAITDNEPKPSFGWPVFNLRRHQVADDILAGMGSDRATQLLAYHAGRIVDAITGGTGGVEIEGLPAPSLIAPPPPKRTRRKALVA